MGEEAHPETDSTGSYIYTKHTGIAHETSYSISVSVFITGVFLGMTYYGGTLPSCILGVDGADYFRLLHSSTEKRKLCSTQVKAYQGNLSLGHQQKEP